MVKNVGKHYRINRKCLVERQIIFPVELFQGIVHLAGIFSFKIIDWFQYAQGRTAMHVRLVHQCLVAGKGDHSCADFHIVGTQSDQLFSQYVFELCHGLGNHGIIFRLNHSFVFNKLT
ncbi:hypothetical protein SDC9_92394 [bioreactor metagenome]|uniref:Uncharacterized protein n=1 Tax=bioreactor metagenome TaxID=1076179 RepID=A0A645A4D4_9ZZZZ